MHGKAKGKIVKTDMLNCYLVKFIIRLAIFLFVFILYVRDKNRLIELFTHKVLFQIGPLGITPLYILWTIFMVMMIIHLFPHKQLSMALLKRKEENYVEVRDYSKLELLQYVQDQNVKAWKVMLVWLSFNAVWGMLYLFEVISVVDLWMLTVFYFLCDYICILFFCPFQTVIMKNKCCVNCRIYDWGHFMMFTPMLFIKNFFSWSLFFTALIVLIRWEIVYTQNPHMFWSGSNQTLQCKHCKDKTCQIKTLIKHGK